MGDGSAAASPCRATMSSSSMTHPPSPHASSRATSPFSASGNGLRPVSATPRLPIAGVANVDRDQNPRGTNLRSGSVGPALSPPFRTLAGRFGRHIRRRLGPADAPYGRAISVRRRIARDQALPPWATPDVRISDEPARGNEMSQGDFVQPPFGIRPLWSFFRAWPRAEGRARSDRRRDETGAMSVRG